MKFPWNKKGVRKLSRTDRAFLTDVDVFLNVLNRVSNAVYDPITTHVSFNKESLEYSLGLARQAIPKQIPTGFESMYKSIEEALTAFEQMDTTKVRKALLLEKCKVTPTWRPDSEPQPNDNTIHKIYDEDTPAYKLARAMSTIDASLGETMTPIPSLRNTLNTVRATGKVERGYFNFLKQVFQTIEEYIARALPAVSEAEFNMEETNLNYLAQGAQSLLNAIDYRKSNLFERIKGLQSFQEKR